MTILHRCGLFGMAALAATTLCATPAKAFYGGYRGGYGGFYRGYGFGGGYGYRGFGYGGFGPGFGAGLALGGLYGGYYPRPYGYYPPPYYAAPPVLYAPPPVFVPPPPLVYSGPPPKPRRIVHRIRRPVAPQYRCLPPLPSSVPAPLRDVPSPGP